MIYSTVKVLIVLKAKEQNASPTVVLFWFFSGNSIIF